MNRTHRILFPVVLLVALFAVAGCKKKEPPPPPSETAPPAGPSANRADYCHTHGISAGDQVVLSLAHDRRHHRLH